MSELNKRLAAKNITLLVTDAALQYAVQQSFDPAYGARPLRRFLDHTLMTDLSRMVVAGKLGDSETVTCDVAPPGAAAAAAPAVNGSAFAVDAARTAISQGAYAAAIAADGSVALDGIGSGI